MLMHDLEVLCNEPWCCILCWQFDMQFSYATHLAHPVLCRPTHFNISGYASGLYVKFWRGRQMALHGEVMTCAINQSMYYNVKQEHER